MAPQNPLAPAAKKTAAPQTPPAPAPAPSTEFTFEVGDFATGKHRASSKVPDNVGKLLEELKDAHGKAVKNAKGEEIGAGVVKFRTVSVPHAAAGDDFQKHVRSYSKTFMYPEWSARLSRLNDTTFRVGVGPVKPKPRRPKNAAPEGTDNA